MNDTHGRGFVLARWERGESDLAVDLFLADGRIQRAIGRSAARSRKRFAAGLQPFTLYRFAFGRVLPPTALALLEASVERAYTGVLEDLRRTSAAGAASALVRDIASEVPSAGPLFARYEALLASISTADGSGCGAAFVRFALDAQDEAGHALELDRCVRCSRAAPASAMVQLDPAAGASRVARAAAGRSRCMHPNDARSSACAPATTHASHRGCSGSSRA